MTCLDLAPRAQTHLIYKQLLSMFSFLMCHRQCRKRGPRKHHYGVGSYGISEESSSRRWSYWSLYRERCFAHVFLSYFDSLFVSFFGLLIFPKVILAISITSFCPPFFSLSIFGLLRLLTLTSLSCTCFCRLYTLHSDANFLVGNLSKVDASYSPSFAIMID